jgi:hypothetical protein
VRKGHRFVSTVVSQPKLFVIGGPDDLARLGPKRVADAPHDESGRDQGASREKIENANRSLHPDDPNGAVATDQ